MKLIYIGRNYEDFVKEAQKYGISRNVPLNAVKTLNWGETILCATHSKYPDEFFEALKRKPDRSGTADLLCSFIFDSLFIRDPDLHAAVMNRLQELGFLGEIKELDEVVERDCGAYIITSATEVTIPIADLVQIIRDMGKRLRIAPKVMIGGQVQDVFEDGEYIPNVKFTRGIMGLEDEQPIVTTAKVVGIKDYLHFDTLEEKYQFKQETLKVFEGSK